MKMLTEGIMSSDINLVSDLNLNECPFFSLCILPKIDFLCKIPACKNCPDYIYKLENLK